ncbi:MAG: response regulator [Nitrospina sp.]|jgi:putative two-component system response regulator|nr:response regulator [Nitrospina sp.]
MNVLIVEDNPVSLSLMENKFKEWGYTTFSAQNGMEAWTSLKSNPVNIVVSDWIMPGIDGLSLCRRIRETDFEHYMYLILVTAQNSQQDIIQGLEAGADDYVAKPVDFEELRARVKIGARIVRTERKLSNEHELIKRSYLQTIRMFTNLQDAFDDGFGWRSRRASELSVKLAKRVPDVPKEDYPLVETAALLHDIGMLSLPRELLSKKRGEMTGEERRIFLSHPILGEIVLKEIESLRPVAELVRAHHEQFNGRGFPDGLHGDGIPLLARIITAAVAYNNLIHKGKVPLENIPENLQRMRGYQLDPAITEQLLEINLESIHEEKGKHYIKIPLDDLQEGMTLAKNVRTRNRVLVMSSKAGLTGTDIETLKKYAALNYIPDNVFVHK